MLHYFIYSTSLTLQFLHWQDRTKIYSEYSILLVHIYYLQNTVLPVHTSMRSITNLHHLLYLVALPTHSTLHYFLTIYLLTNTTYIKFSSFLPAEKGRWANDWYRYWLHWDKWLQFGACRQTLPHWSKTLSVWITLYKQTRIFKRSMRFPIASEKMSYGGVFFCYMKKTKNCWRCTTSSYVVVY